MITTYRLYLRGRNDGDEAIILLFGEEGCIARMTFRGVAGNAAHQADNGTWHWPLPRNRYADAVDLLRNESPVFFRVYGDSEVSLATDAEPVGEGE